MEKSIVLIVPYIGKWPIWFDAHLVSIAANTTVNWLFITDCKIPENYPANVRFVPTTLDALNKKINDVLAVTVPLTPRKLCDIRPAYGKIFKDYIADFDFWGFCDLDIIWGDIRKFVTNDLLEKHDILSSRKNTISGHFTILKNEERINTLYKQIPLYSKLLSEKKLMRVDEEAFTVCLADIERDKNTTLNIYWKEYLMNHVDGKAHQEYYLDKWLWKDKKMLELKDGVSIKEVMYLHFINWKQFIKYCEVSYTCNPKEFYISFNGIHFKEHSKLIKKLNALKNVFNGYVVREKRRLRKNRLQSLLKRVKRKLKL